MDEPPHPDCVYSMRVYDRLPQDWRDYIKDCPIGLCPEDLDEIIRESGPVNGLAMLKRLVQRFMESNPQCPNLSVATVVPNVGTAGRT